MKQDLIKQLKELPADIEAKENEILVRKNDLEELKHSIEYYKSQVTQKVEDESKENKELSNATKRASEVKRRLDNSTTYKTLIDDYKEKNIIFEVFKLKIERLKREFRGAEAIARLGRWKDY